jgi:hypothetical protein
MKMYDNAGHVVAEQNVIFRQDGGYVTTNTMYDGDTGRPAAQTVSVKDTKGNAHSETVFNGKLLP